MSTGWRRERAALLVALLAGVTGSTAWSGVRATDPAPAPAATPAPARPRGGASAGPEDGLESSLAEMSLEELMSIEITSVRKKHEHMMDAAAAIFVLTREDIRRSGATTIPELLRMVPGVQVARIDANKWAISVRGFNSRFANKLLVLIDGRSVYTPAFSGVYWEHQDLMLEDIERIEVIRGPGGTLWGANAVNGVINIITRKAGDTQGGVAVAGGGKEELGFGAARFGARIGESLAYRVWGKYFARDDSGDDESFTDDWYGLHGGLRVDWDLGERDALTFIASTFYVRPGIDRNVPTLNPPAFSRRLEDHADVNGQSILGRWKHRISEGSDLDVQAYYDRYERDEAVIGQQVDTLDVELQHRFQLPLSQEILYGLNYRSTFDSFDSTETLAFSPSRRTLQLLSFFLQDDISLLDGRIRLTLGSKFDYDTFTRFEAQPSARILWVPHEHHRVWAAVSRAVRTPSRADRDSRIIFQTLPGAPPAQTVFTGNDRFTSEDLFAVELGYRGQILPSLSLDVAGFVNHYDNLRTLEVGAASLVPGPPLHAVVPTLFDNKAEADTLGVEVASTWTVQDWWRLSGTFTFLRIDVRTDSNSTDAITTASEGTSPTHMATLRSLMDLPGNVELDSTLYYVDSLPADGIPSYVRLDFRVGWKPVADDTVDLSVVFQNVLDGRHPEFGAELERASEVERSLFVVLRVRF